MRRDTSGVSGIILAGGKNTRMGTDKALLKVGSHFIIERIATVLRRLVDEILIVTNCSEIYARFGDKIVNDILGGHGPLGGIHAGLINATYDRALVTACDMPFISASLLNLLIQNSAGYNVVVPLYHGLPEPLCALYKKNCVDIIECQLLRRQNKITGFYDQVKVRYLNEIEMKNVEPNLDRVFFNLNTPENLIKAQSFLNFT